MSSQTDKFYVYALTDPRDGGHFYIGKGCGRRAWSHLRKAEWQNAAKCDRIAAIRAAGHEPIVEILHKDLAEANAYALEAELISERKASLTNACPGGGVENSAMFLARRVLNSLKDDWQVRVEGGNVAERIRLLHESRAVLEPIAYPD